ncbi:type I-F CRISPR-associated endoribonuclease Cas6/Csy4 [Cysteiniphilum sp. 6C5]|uniref:type I-F CRISPR-associated endoribonuclease Cas6/Csy4 n=1 Tax=unclassified Cysteiniphilum TaxID=2610889 RepID=UPI003F82C9AF
MNYYLNIVIKPDAEMRLNFLLNNIYTKLHKALCDLNLTNIGVSFPKYSITLGNVLRIHSDRTTLQKLQNSNWIDGMHGYCKISEIQLVPAGAKFRTISRVQTTMSNAKLKRLQKRGSISVDEVKQYKAKMYNQGLDNPYLELVSASNGHKHRRYIAFGELQDHPTSGQFDFFGLSKEATIPWFD